jgi:two-component system chemotaxis response regulator CheY
MGTMSRILLVDDSAFMRMFLKSILSEDGHEIVGEANNGVDAFETFKKVKPDLTLMDITMPEMDGIQAVKKIREFEQSARIVMVSAMGQEFFIKEALRAGACDFIVKPFKKEKVKEVTNRVLGYK